MEPLTFQSIAFRLFLALLFSGIIGWEREFNSRPAGIRTNIMVCVGATIIAMIQTDIIHQTLEIARLNPDLSAVIRSDPARLICQVVSGIGFLGAGTIVITKSDVRGLTTAATLWAMAGLGLAIGMGYYLIACLGFAAIVLVVIVIKRLIHFHTRQHIKIKFNHREDTQDFIQNYFNNHKIRVTDSDFSLDVDNDARVYTIRYTIEIPNNMTYSDVAEGICVNKNIQHISLVNI